MIPYLVCDTRLYFYLHTACIVPQRRKARGLLPPRAKALEGLKRGVSYYKVQLDAMWAGLKSGKYTINGYSAWNPIENDGLYNASASTSAQSQVLKNAYHQWLFKYSIPIDRSCYVYTN